MSLAETIPFSLEKNLLEKGGQKILSFIFSSFSPPALLRVSEIYLSFKRVSNSSLMSQLVLLLTP